MNSINNLWLEKYEIKKPDYDLKTRPWVYVRKLFQGVSNYRRL